jgi:hypothetical protein
MRNGSLAFDTVGVGIEAETHSVWGRWHNKCVIGPEGSPSGCDDSHGGDGVVYVYNGTYEQVGAISGHPNWLSNSRVGYGLRPMSELYAFARQQGFCGQDEANALYACHGEGMPWDVMNGDITGDAGVLPWAWTEWGTASNTCAERNVIMQPGFIFNRYFMWPPGRFDACTYSWNGFAFDTIPLCTVQSACPAEFGPVSEEFGKQFASCGPNNRGVTGFRCAGSYCDDMYFTCSVTPTGTGANALGGYWTPYFSEENPARVCTSDGSTIDGVVDGIQATGSYADNVSLHCARLTSGQLTNCNWTAWFSEEQGLQNFNGKFVVGAVCSGAYCDNMSFLICNLVP